MSNSSLVNVTMLSRHHSGTRIYPISRISVHAVVGQLSAESIGNCFMGDREASCNYGIGTDGRVVLCVDEGNRSWCTSSKDNDNRAVTIECASDSRAPYAFNDAVYNKLVDLCVDICQRNGKTKLIWINDKSTALAYQPAADELILTVHRWFANKSCPGDWMMGRMSDLAATVTARLGGAAVVPGDASSPIYRVQCGAFSNKKNASALVSSLKNAGYSSALIKVASMYKVQCGAFAVKSNAEALAKKLKSAGFDCVIATNVPNCPMPGPTPALEPTPAPAPAPQPAPAPAQKSAQEIAQEIMKGSCSDSRWDNWGTGDVRKSRLTEAGYDAAAVQAAVNALASGAAAPTPKPASKTSTDIALEIIKGTCSDSRWNTWGTGLIRRSRLNKAGYNAAEVQAEVNRLCK